MENAQIYSMEHFYAKNISAEVYSLAVIHFNGIKANALEFNVYVDGKIFCDGLSVKYLEINVFTGAEVVVFGKSGTINITAISASVDSKDLIIENNLN